MLSTSLMCGKWQVLEALRGQLKTAIVLPLLSASADEWRSDRAAVLARLQDWSRANAADSIIVRSSAVAEDGDKSSCAGQFLSVPDIPARNPERLAQAIDQVVESLPDREHDAFFVQPMLLKVRLAGVAFGLDPQTGASYYVVSYDDSTGCTALVTSGARGDTKSYMQHHCARSAPTAMQGVIQLMKELENLFGTSALDVEFAVTASGELVLFQVRHLRVQDAPIDAETQARALAEVEHRVAGAQRPHPFLAGQRTVFGIMPDWNPAEIIGSRPRPLALSLYRNLVTDSIWAYQRNNYGYRDLRSFPLLQHFFGQPFVDVRVSLNSFIPRDIDSGLANKLVDYYIEKLVASPSLHDKIEFQIVFSCYSLDLPKRLKPLTEHGFAPWELSLLTDSLRRLTNDVVHPVRGLWRSDEKRLSKLVERRGILADSDADTLTTIYWLLEDCKRYGTLPFAGLARAGFIAVQMLQSLVSIGVLTPAEHDRFLRGLKTVSGEMNEDLGRIDQEAFLRTYGHLRPGTYDILAPRYDEAPERYFDFGAPMPKYVSDQSFRLSLGQIRDIGGLLEEHGIESDVVGLFEFIEAGIVLRERAKFIFTRNLSEALRLYSKLGESLGVSREDLSFSDIACVYELYSGVSDARDVLTRSVEAGRERFRTTCTLCLPALISNPQDVWSFHRSTSEPSFITSGRVLARTADPTTMVLLAGLIVVIESADPGFDWIFARNIAGFVTKYGGSNSHMAIRASELGIPAAIGVGDLMFEACRRGTHVLIDCAARRLEVVA